MRSHFRSHSLSAESHGWESLRFILALRRRPSSASSFMVRFSSLSFDNAAEKILTCPGSKGRGTSTYRVSTARAPTRIMSLNPGFFTPHGFHEVAPSTGSILARCLSVFICSFKVGVDTFLLCHFSGSGPHFFTHSATDCFSSSIAAALSSGCTVLSASIVSASLSSASACFCCGERF